MQTEHRIIALAADLAGRAAGDFHIGMSFADDFGLDSLDRLQLVQHVEDHFSISISDAECDDPEHGTPGGLTGLVNRKLAESERREEALRERSMVPGQVIYTPNVPGLIGAGPLNVEKMRSMKNIIQSNGVPDTAFRTELAALLNRHSRENGSNTPDFVLAVFLLDSLAAFDAATRAREVWHGRATAA